jgi:DNA-binding HxlR family transcriptional regulator
VTIVQAEIGYEHIDDSLCRSFQVHLEVVGRKWNSGILLAAMRGATRFSEYRSLVSGVSDRLLSQRLRELEAEGLIERVVTPTTPVLVRYLPTERGRELMRVLQPLVHWGASQS